MSNITLGSETGARECSNCGRQLQYEFDGNDNTGVRLVECPCKTSDDIRARVLGREMKDE